jgi:Zn-finger nucleic acid-binding protein
LCGREDDRLQLICIPLYGGHKHRGSPTNQRESSVQCTLCDGTSGPDATFGPVTVDRCGACGGLWFDRTELAAALVHRVPQIAVDWGTPVPSAATGPVCPRDQHTVLRRYDWLGVQFWRCPACLGVLMTGTGWGRLLATAQDRAARRERRQDARLGADLVMELLIAIIG